VQSENETDHAKVGRRACNLDVLIDLVPRGTGRVRRYEPKRDPVDDEDAYCRLVGRQALRIGRLGTEWVQAFSDELRS
jgi:hypothetical protein